MRDTSDDPGYYPVFLRVRGKSCVIIGGGRVATRKAATLVDRGARVRVVAPAFCSELRRLAAEKKIETRPGAYRAADLYGAFLAVAATSSPGVNTRVVRDARRRGILLNVVDKPGQSDFILPSHFRRGDLMVAVSTSGKSPALARKIRTGLESRIGDGYEALTGLVEEVRRKIRMKGVRINGEGWQEALDLDVMLELLNQGRRAKARDWLLRRLGEVVRKAKPKGIRE